MILRTVLYVWLNLLTCQPSFMSLHTSCMRWKRQVTLTWMKALTTGTSVMLKMLLLKLLRTLMVTLMLSSRVSAPMTTSRRWLKLMSPITLTQVHQVVVIKITLFVVLYMSSLLVALKRIWWKVKHQVLNCVMHSEHLHDGLHAFIKHYVVTWMWNLMLRCVKCLIVYLQLKTRLLLLSHVHELNRCSPMLRWQVWLLKNFLITNSVKKKSKTFRQKHCATSWSKYWHVKLSNGGKKKKLTWLMKSWAV